MTASSNACSITSSGTFNIEAKSACYVTALTIDSSSNIFNMPALIQNVWDPVASSFTWSDAILEHTISGLDCGVAQFQVMNIDESPLDSSIFTTSLSAVQGSTQIFSAQTDDPSKANTYNLRVKAFFTSYPTNIAQKDFTVLITNTCDLATVTPSSLSNQFYMIGSGQQNTVAFDRFVNPSYCPFSYEMEVNPLLSAADSNAITLNSVNREYTFLST